MMVQSGTIAWPIRRVKQFDGTQQVVQILHPYLEEYSLMPEQSLITFKYP